MAESYELNLGGQDWGLLAGLDTALYQRAEVGTVHDQIWPEYGFFLRLLRGRSIEWQNGGATCLYEGYRPRWKFDYLLGQRGWITEYVEEMADDVSKIAVKARVIGYEIDYKRKMGMLIEDYPLSITVDTAAADSDIEKLLHVKRLQTRKIMTKLKTALPKPDSYLRLATLLGDGEEQTRWLEE
jgi:hypothetical protein